MSVQEGERLCRIEAGEGRQVFLIDRHTTFDSQFYTLMGKSGDRDLPLIRSDDLDELFKVVRWALILGGWDNG